VAAAKEWMIETLRRTRAIAEARRRPEMRRQGGSPPTAPFIGVQRRSVRARAKFIMESTYLLKCP